MDDLSAAKVLARVTGLAETVFERHANAVRWREVASKARNRIEALRAASSCAQEAFGVEINTSAAHELARELAEKDGFKQAAALLMEKMHGARRASANATVEAMDAARTKPIGDAIQPVLFSARGAA